MSARSLLSRVRKLVTGEVNPILKRIGSIERFHQIVTERIAEGLMCPIDGPFIVDCVRRWVSDTHHIRNGNKTSSFALSQEQDA